MFLSNQIDTHIHLYGHTSQSLGHIYMVLYNFPRTIHQYILKHKVIFKVHAYFVYNIHLVLIWRQILVVCIKINLFIELKTKNNTHSQYTCTLTTIISVFSWLFDYTCLLHYMFYSTWSWGEKESIQTLLKIFQNVVYT